MLLPFSFQTACPPGPGRDLPCQGVAPAGRALHLCWVQPPALGEVRQGSPPQPGLTSTRAIIGCNVEISLRSCVRCWGLWPVAQGTLALASSPIRGGSPRTGRPPPIVLPVPTKQNRVPRAWLTERSARACVQVCAAPRAGATSPSISQSSSEALAPQPGVSEDKGHSGAAPLLLQHRRPDASITREKGEFCRPQPEPEPTSPGSDRPRLGPEAVKPRLGRESRASGRPAHKRDAW